MVYHDHDESNNFDGNAVGYAHMGASMDSRSYVQSAWAQIAETTMPLKASKFAAANQGASFQESVELRSRQLASRIININLISLLVNLTLAAAAFYFAFVNDSSSMTAFAADCVLDFISSAIVLWRYFGDDNGSFMYAREQIACIYLGALFGISSVAIIAKGISDIISGVELEGTAAVSGSFELVALAIAATIACSVLTVFKCLLFKALRDNSILLDVINTLISTVFAMSIVMSQALINIDPTFWYLDPILSIILALFMLGFGIKVIHQNFNVLKPAYFNQSPNSPIENQQTHRFYNTLTGNSCTITRSDINCVPEIRCDFNSNYGSNLNSSVKQARHSWHKTDYSTVIFN